MDARKLSYKERIQARKYLRAENKQFSATMASISIEQRPGGPFAAWRSRDFLCSACSDQGFVRLSINRTDIDLDTGDWIAGISWDELMTIKEQCGLGEFWAVEVYPPASEIVNVTNMRHLWLLKDGEPAFGWKRRESES